MEGKVCRINGCTKILKKTDGQICQMHRSRFFRHGSYEISPNWPNLKKGQPCTTKAGYVRINVNGKRVQQHRYIMEQHLGRKLSPKEVVHHKNGIRTDNRIENLELLSDNKSHMKKHHPYAWESRKISPRYTKNTIAKILERIHLPPYTYDKCFCSGEYVARNLCCKHYQWAYKHKKFTPDRGKCI